MGPVAEELRGFGPIGILAIAVILAGNLVVVPLSAVLVLVWARRSRTPWSEIGYVRPRSWFGGLAAGVVLGIALKLVLKAVVMPLLGAPPVNPYYRHLVGNTAALPGMLYLILAGAGFGEETLFRGYMFERLGKLVGTGAGAKIVTVLVTSALFGAAHLAEQGLAGAEQAAIVGLVLGSIFAVTGSLWTPICVHVAFDLTALALIYWDLESEVAHLVFEG